MKVCLRAAVALAVLAALTPASARAQLPPTTPDNAGSRVRLGPFWLDPSISLSNVGVDTNLFNDARAEDQRRDLAMAIVPQTDLWMRAGRTWINGNIRQDVIWFRDFRDEGSSNGAYRLGWIVPLTRLSIVLDGQLVRAKERPSLEIDARARRRQIGATGAVEVRALSRTYFGARAERHDVQFTAGARFNGTDLQAELNRRRSAATGTIRHAVTPMTNFVVEVGGYRDEFAYATDRDAASVHAAAGIRFDPAALVKGTVLVGRRRFIPASHDIPEFSGTTVTATLSYVALTSTRISLEAIRDLDYSFEATQPYYLLSGVAGTATQRIAGPVDVQARLGYRTLDYRSRFSAAVPDDRRDTVTTVGGGIGYRAASALRVAFNVERQRRTSPLEQRRYDGLRYGVSATYALSPYSSVAPSDLR